jgi:drug/metabolite transporter (DMT)-like permease
VTHGIAVAVMCILLHTGIARGPIAVVVPIVAAHPALVLVVNVLMGVRPSAAQWAAVAVIIAGGIFIARTAVAEPEAAEAESIRVTVLIAIGACLAYVAIVLTSQAATPLIGAPQTMWVGRWTGLIFIAGVLLVQRAPLRIPAEWLPFVGLQASLDTLGYIAFLAGSNSAAPHIHHGGRLRLQRGGSPAGAADRRRAGEQDAMGGDRPDRRRHGGAERDLSLQPQTRPERTESI